MRGAILVAEIQILFFTLYLLVSLKLSSTSAFKILFGFLSWFLVTQPVTTYCYILLGVVYEDDGIASALTRSKKRSCSLHMNSIWISLRRYLINPFLFSALSCGLSVAGGVDVSIIALTGLAFCYFLVMVSLFIVVRKESYS